MLPSGGASAGGGSGGGVSGGASVGGGSGGSVSPTISNVVVPVHRSPNTLCAERGLAQSSSMAILPMLHLSKAFVDRRLVSDASDNPSGSEVLSGVNAVERAAIWCRISMPSLVSQWSQEAGNAMRIVSMFVRRAVSLASLWDRIAARAG